MLIFRVVYRSWPNGQLRIAINYIKKFHTDELEKSHFDQNFCTSATYIL